MKYLSLFSGIGGMDLGLDRAGMTCIGQVEIDPFCRAVLAKHWPDVPRWDDVRTFSAGMLSEQPDLIAFGFPCQDLSYAGRGAGLDGARSGLFFEAMRIVRVVRPDFLLVENVAALLDRGMGRVLAELAACGFDADWSVLPACALGAPHSRERVFLVAYSHKIRHRARFHSDEPPPRCNHWKATQGKEQWSDVELWLRQTFQAGDGATSRPEAAGISDGVPTELGNAACDAYGNAVVPQVAEYIGRLILAADGRAVA